MAEPVRVRWRKDGTVGLRCNGCGEETEYRVTAEWSYLSVPCGWPDYHRTGCRHPVGLDVPMSLAAVWPRVAGGDSVVDGAEKVAYWRGRMDALRIVRGIGPVTRKAARAFKLEALWRLCGHRRAVSSRTFVRTLDEIGSGDIRSAQRIILRLLHAEQKKKRKRKGGAGGPDSEIVRGLIIAARLMTPLVNAQSRLERWDGEA